MSHANQFRTKNGYPKRQQDPDPAFRTPRISVEVVKIAGMSMREYYIVAKRFAGIWKYLDEPKNRWVNFERFAQVFDSVTEAEDMARKYRGEVRTTWRETNA